jgi:hypothetical protein
MKKLVLLLALLVVSPAAWAVNQTTKMGDANYSVKNTDTLIVTQQAFTAPRTLTLPYAGGTGIGQTVGGYTLEFFDTLGTITSSNTLTITPQSGDTINGSTSPIVVNSTGAHVVLYPLSGSGWSLSYSVPTLPLSAANGGTGGTSGVPSLPLSVANGGTGNAGGAPTAYTPAFTCGSGSITTPGALTGAYQQVGKVVTFTLYAAITTIGTCATSLSVSLPVAASGSYNQALNGFDGGTSLKTINGYIGATGSTMALHYYDGTLPNASGVVVIFTGTYFAN